MVSEREIGAAAWRDETDAEHIARDVREGRFPSRSLRQKVPVTHPAQQQSGKVEVKPLEWRDIDGPVILYAAGSEVGRYEISREGEVYLTAVGAETWETSSRTLIISDVDANSSTLKAAAQADFESRILSALTAGKPEQSGWKLVPEEPTEEMCRALLNVDGWSAARAFKSYNWSRAFWKAMLAASPTPPTAGGGDE